MSAKNIFLTIVISCFATLHAGAQYISVFKAMKNGDSELLADFLDKQIELSIQGEGFDTQNSFSKTQAKAILKDFFEKSLPTQFDQKFDGKANEWMRYIIGYLYTEKGKFRTLIRFKHFEDEGFVIQEIELTHVEEE